jgi:hypothetical protein
VGELEMVLVMEKPVPEVRTNFGDFVGPVAMETRMKTSAAMTSAAMPSATVLACRTAFVRLSCFISSTR